MLDVPPIEVLPATSKVPPIVVLPDTLTVVTNPATFVSPETVAVTSIKD